MLIVRGLFTEKYLLNFKVTFNTCNKNVDIKFSAHVEFLE